MNISIKMRYDMGKIVKHVAKSFLIDDIIENPDELYRTFKEIDKMSQHLKSPRYRSPFSPIHATFGEHFNIVNSGERTVVCVMAALHEDDTVLSVSIVICTPMETITFIHSPACKLFMKEYITQVCRLFIEAGHGVIATLRLIQQTFDMDRSDTLMNYHDTIKKYFPNKTILCNNRGESNCLINE